jgi:hypothetical protein
MLKQMIPHKNLTFRNLITDCFTHVFKRDKTDSELPVYGRQVGLLRVYREVLTNS